MPAAGAPLDHSATVNGCIRGRSDAGYGCIREHSDAGNGRVVPAYCGDC
jgi:hypothetical protein